METTDEPPGDRSTPPERQPENEPPRRTERTRPSPKPPSGADPKTAGFLLVAAIVLLGGIGLGIGALIGAPVPFTIAGLFGGLVLGFRLVYSRFRDI